MYICKAALRAYHNNFTQTYISTSPPFPPTSEIITIYILHLVSLSYSHPPLHQTEILNTSKYYQFSTLPGLPPFFLFGIT